MEYLCFTGCRGPGSKEVGTIIGIFQRENRDRKVIGNPLEIVPDNSKSRLSDMAVCLILERKDETACGEKWFQTKLNFMKLLWEDRAWDDYLSWQTEDKRTLKRINLLINDIRRHPYTGIGKPEPLKGNLSSYWSRRIDSVNRIVYREFDGAVLIISCRGHYD